MLNFSSSSASSFILPFSSSISPSLENATDVSAFINIKMTPKYPLILARIILSRSLFQWNRDQGL